MKCNNIVLNLQYIKDLLKRFKEKEELTKETNTFSNGLNLIVERGY